MLLTGSNAEAPAGALLFENDGSVHLHLAEDITEEEREAIVLASDFFQYALHRDDWLREFADSIMEDTRDLELGEIVLDSRDEKIKLTKNDLFVIKGGKPDEELN
jgi:hypothetical protein